MEEYKNILVKLGVLIVVTGINLWIWNGIIVPEFIYQNLPYFNYWQMFCIILAIRLTVC